MVRSPSFSSKESSRGLLTSHDVRATLECGPPWRLRDWDSALTVRRPKPLIPLTTAPHRVSAKSRNSFPGVTVLIARTSPSASTGAVIAINASDTNSFLVTAFMRFFSLCVLSAVRRRVRGVANDHCLSSDVPSHRKQQNITCQFIGSSLVVAKSSLCGAIKSGRE